MQRGDLRCKCGHAARVGSAKKHAGRLSASCSAWSNGCGYFRWLEPAPQPAPGPPTPDRPAAAAAAAAPLTPSPQWRPIRGAAPQHTPASPSSPAGIHAAHACVRAFLIVRAAASAAAGWQETVSLLLLPALHLPPAACSALYQPAGERRLPHAPAAAASLQPPYVRIQAWAPSLAVRDLLQRCISAAGGGRGGGNPLQLFVLDTETTGFSSELGWGCD